MNKILPKSIGILSNPSDFHQIDDVSGVPGTPTSQKICAKRSISTQKLPTKKNVIFAKIIFSQKFSLFSRPQNPKIRDLTDLAMCTSLTAQIHQNPSKSEDLMLVEKMDLEDKKSPKIENFIFCFFNFHIS